MVKLRNNRRYRRFLQMKKLFLDLDDTYLDTDRFIRYTLALKGVSKEYWGIEDDIYTVANIPECKDIIKSCMSNYHAIPLKTGAKESLKILQTEYIITFVTSAFSNYEIQSKKKLLDSMKVPYIITGRKKSHIDMSGGIQVDDHLGHLNQSNAKKKIFFYNKFEMNPKTATGTLEKDYTMVKDWFELTDILMSGGEDNELREYICSRVQRICKASRV